MLSAAGPPDRLGPVPLGVVVEERLASRYGFLLPSSERFAVPSFSAPAEGLPVPMPPADADRSSRGELDELGCERPWFMLGVVDEEVVPALDGPSAAPPRPRDDDEGEEEEDDDGEDEDGRVRSPVVDLDGVDPFERLGVPDPFDEVDLLAVLGVVELADARSLAGTGGTLVDPFASEALFLGGTGGGVDLPCDVPFAVLLDVPFAVPFDEVVVDRLTGDGITAWRSSNGSS